MQEEVVTTGGPEKKINKKIVLIVTHLFLIASVIAVFAFVNRGHPHSEEEVAQEEIKEEAIVEEPQVKEEVNYIELFEGWERVTINEEFSVELPMDSLKSDLLKREKTHIKVPFTFNKGGYDTFVLVDTAIFASSSTDDYGIFHIMKVADATVTDAKTIVRKYYDFTFIDCINADRKLYSGGSIEVIPAESENVVITYIEPPGCYPSQVNAPYYLIETGNNLYVFYNTQEPLKKAVLEKIVSSFMPL